MRNPLNLPPVVAPAGYYSVPDPDDPGRLTSWQVDRNGFLHRYPSTCRWEPLRPPELAEIENRQERYAAVNRWYETVYRRWKVAVIEAIGADPHSAAQAFHQRHPAVSAASTARRLGLERARRFVQARAVMTAALSARGEAVSAASRRLAVSRSTVREWVVAGNSLVVADPDAVRAVLTDCLANVSGDGHDVAGFIEMVIASVTGPASSGSGAAGPSDQLVGPEVDLSGVADSLAARFGLGSA